MSGSGDGGGGEGEVVMVAVLVIWPVGVGETKWGRVTGVMK